jgi:hypothetical protein
MIAELVVSGLYERSPCSFRSLSLRVLYLLLYLVVRMLLAKHGLANVYSPIIFSANDPSAKSKRKSNP